MPEDLDNVAPAALVSWYEEYLQEHAREEQIFNDARRTIYRTRQRCIVFRKKYCEVAMTRQRILKKFTNHPKRKLRTFQRDMLRKTAYDLKCIKGKMKHCLEVVTNELEIAKSSWTRQDMLLNTLLQYIEDNFGISLRPNYARAG